MQNLTELDISKLLLESVEFLIKNNQFEQEKQEKLNFVKNYLLMNIGPRIGQEILIKDQKLDSEAKRAIITGITDSTFQALRIGEENYISFNLSFYNPTRVIEYNTNPEPLQNEVKELYVVYPNGYWTIGDIIDKKPKSLTLKTKNDEMDFEIPSGSGIGKWKGYKVYMGMDQAISASKNIKGIVESNN